MKRQFLLVCTFIFAVTTGILQADSNPTMSRVYGNQFTPQVADTQSAAAIGTLDTTFATAGTGSLSISSALSNPQGLAIQTLSDGTFIVVLSTAVSSTATKYNAEGSLATYGTAGVATLGVGTTSTARASMLDVQGRLLVAGGAASGTAGWIVRVSTDGTVLTPFVTSTNWEFVGGLAQQTTGKTIAVGFNGSNAQIGRYNLDGTLDTTSSFGTAGLVALNGSGILPTVGTGLFSVVVDASDRIYVAFIAAGGTGFTSGNAYIARFTALGVLDTSGAGSWPVAGFAALADLNSAISGLYVAVNQNGNFIVGANVSTNILVTGVTSSGGAIGGSYPFNSTVVASQPMTITGLITTSDNGTFVVGSDTTSSQMTVIKLLGTAGSLDGSFNGTGYNLFSIAGASRTASYIQAAGIAVDGQLYTAGYQINSGTTVPYVSRLNNTQYVSQVAQFPATTSEQGILDQTFGTPTKQTFSGVTNLYNGLYGSSMMQQANAAIEVTAGSVTHGDILVGMNGFANDGSQHMMLGWLTAEGSVDTSTHGGVLNGTGYLTLTNPSSSSGNETLVSMLEAANGEIYIAGTSSTDGAFVRGYGTFTSPTAAYATTPVASTDAVGLSLQGITTPSTDYRTLLCVTETGTQLTGSIYGYNSSAALDTTFGPYTAGVGSSQTGFIAPTSYTNLHMGPSYGLVVATTGAEAFIYAAYLDTTSLGVCVAKFQENGSGLIPEFGTSASGIAQNIFTGHTVAANNVRIGLLENGHLVVAAVTTTQILVAFLNPVDGSIDNQFVQALTVLGVTTALDLSRVTGVSDGTAMLTFWGTTSADKIMYVARVLANGTGLDTSFNSQGLLPGVLPIQIGDKVSNYTARSATSAIIQSTPSTGYQGNIAVVGYESVTTNDATPMAMRVYGTPGTTEVMDFPINVVEPGTFDTAYDLQSLLGNGFGKVIFNYPTSDVHNSGKMLVGIDTGTNTIVARVNQSMVLDTSSGGGNIPFNGSTGYVTLSTYDGVNHVSIDAQDNILVGGTSVQDTPFGWAFAINNAGTSQTQFTMPGSIAAVNNIGQQESGRYIVAATETTTNKGMLIAFQDKVSAGAFAVDPTFNPLGFGSATAGSFYLPSTDGLYAMAINTTYNAPSPGPLCNIDTIVVAYSISNVAQIAEVTADGSGFAIAAFAATGVLAESSAVVQVNIDSSQNIVVGASRGASVYVKRYNSAGALGGTSLPITSRSQFSGTGVSAGVQTVAFNGSSSVTLTGLMETTAQQTVLTGYNTPSGSPIAQGDLFAARLVADGALDTIWNTSPAGSDYAGLLTYNSTGTLTPGAINVTGSAIASPNGNIYSIGSTTGTAGSSDAIVTVVYGDNLVTQISQNPLESAAGTLDNTIPGNTSGLGALPLSDLVTGVPQKIYIYNIEVNNSPNGAMLIASVAADQHAYITQLNADLSLNSSHFGTSGVVTIDFGVGYAPTITDMYVATGNIITAQKYIYLTGYTLHTGTRQAFAVRVSADGTTSPIQTLASPASDFSTTDTDLVAGCIRQSSNNRVLVSGYSESRNSGQVVAYNSTMTAIDTSFGNGSGATLGYYRSGTDYPIVAMATDHLDRIYIAYKLSDGVINVQRLLENGTAPDPAFGTQTVTGAALSTTQIKMAIDLGNSQLIVAAQDITGTTSIIQLARFNLSNGGPAGSINTITLGGTTVLNLSDLFIDNDSTGSAYPNIYVVGYTNGGNSVVARVATTSSSIALDTTYGPYVSGNTGPKTGIANLSEGAMTVVTAAALDEDRRVYLVGSNEVIPYDGSAAGYIGRFFGDYYWTEAYPTTTQAVVGSVDTTLSPTSPTTGVAAIDLNTQFGSSTLVGYTAYAVLENPVGDGTAFIAFGNGTSVIVGKLNADMSPASFGSGGLTATQAMVTVNNMTIDALGNIIVTGASVSAQVVYLYSSAGILLATFDAPTVASTQGTTVAQQKSGRYIVGGYDGTAHGLVSAYKNPSAISGSALAVDLTFGPAGSNGYYQTANASPVDDLCIDSNDYIYIVYRVSNVVTIAKLTPEGSLSTAINTPTTQLWSSNPITTGITATALQPACIAINSANNILVGAPTTAGVSTALYNGAAGTIIGSVLAQTLSNTPILTRLVGSGTDFYGSMYNSVPSAGGYVFAVDNTGILDTGFNGGVVLQLTGQTPSLTAGINGLSVQFDGKVVAVGYNGTDPILMRAYGYEYVSQFAQAPDQIAAGQLDTTLWPASSSAGAFLLDATSNSTFNSAITGMAITRVYEAGNGVMTFLATNGSDSIVFRLLKDLTLDTSFNHAGYADLININANALYVNPTTGNIYMAGNSGSSTWASALNSSGGNLSPSFYAGPGLATGNQIAQQSVGRVILAGQGGSPGQANTHGYIVGYTNTGALDITFGNGGQVDMTVTTAITDIAIDSTVYYDNIIAVSNNSGTVVLQRVNAAGSVVTTLTGGTAITGAVGNPKVVFDSAGYIVVACATSSGYAVRSYHNDATATDNAVLATFTAGTTPKLSNIYATSDEKITLIGYDSAITGGTAYDAIVARLVSASGLLTFDGTFNTALTGAGTPQAGVLIASLGGSLSMNQFLDGIIHADDRIMVVGSNLTTPAPYMARVFGDQYVTYDSQAPLAGIAGTINTGFGNTSPTTGSYDDSSLNPTLLNGAQGKAILPLADGGYYQAFDHANGAASSILIKTLADGSLDTTYNNTVGGNIPGIAGSATTPSYAPLGVQSILQGVVSGADSASTVLLVGANGSGGWLQRYASDGTIDSAFGTVTVTPTAAGTTIANVAVEQTLARYVVAGFDGAHAALFAYESLAPNGTPGTVDTTFNSTGDHPGRFILSSNTNQISTLVADQYDRLIFAVLNAGNVDLYRLTPTGEPDVTFGASNGIVASALTGVTSATQIRVALDSLGHIMVVASSSTPGTLSVAAYDNGTLASSGGNGTTIYGPSLSTQSNIVTGLTAPAVTAFVTSTDIYALVLGTQTAPDAAWIARIQISNGALDTAGFNPSGTIHGIFQYAGGAGTTGNLYYGLAVNADGTLGMLGYQVTHPVSADVYTPTLVSVYDNPYTSQESQTPDSKPVGSIDATLGVGSTLVVADGIKYYGVAGGAANYGQVAEAVALYDDNNIVVAIDGGVSNGGASQIMINMFDNDGLLYNQTPAFGTAGQASVLSTYQNQYVRDMVTFTAGGITKAILAGYVTNSALPGANQNSSLLLQYILTPGLNGLDPDFGGFDENPAGIAFGDGKQAFVVGQQSTGRIIVGGLSQDTSPLGLLLGYTAAGKLDTSFANDGYQSVNTGTTGIYTHAIDSQNRIVIAYNDGSNNLVVARMLADGSGLDPNFNTTPAISTLLSNSNIKVAVDRNDNVYVAAGITGNSISVSSYDNGDGDTNNSVTITGTSLGNGSAVYTMARTIVDTAGNVILVAYDDNAHKNVVVRLVNALTLDPTFNAVNAITNPLGTPGYITYSVGSGSTSQVATDAMVHPDGRIIVVGSEL